mgnify:CR=1 FL=1
MSHKRRVVVTGMGIVSPVGNSIAQAWDNISNGRSGIGAITTVGTNATAIFTDLTNQEGVGHNTYQPDYQGGAGDPAARANREANATSDPPPDPGPAPTGGGQPSTPGPLGGPSGDGAAAGSDAALAARAGTAAAGGSAGAAEVAVVAL